MLRPSKLPLLFLLILCLNVLIYVRASLSIEDVQQVFEECARNSGRTSAAINLGALFMIGHFGVKTIYAEAGKKDAFRVLLTLFAVNHLFHFYFVSHYFKDQHMVLAISHNIHGFITFMFLLFIPVVLWVWRKLNRVLYAAIILHLFNVTYFICITFYARYKPVDPAYLHRLGILVMIAALLNMLRRVYLERAIPFPVPPLARA